MDELLNEAQYWTSKLKKVAADTESINTKINVELYVPLTTEEMFKLRENLRMYKVYTDLLDETMSSIANYKKPSWKNIFQKK